jgi:hypothetical protein
MENLVSAGSSDLPVFNLNRETGILYLGGSSLPENVLEVYKPVLNWLDNYIADPNPITKIEFFFEYLNTSSSHMIMRILEKIIALKNLCNELTINWYYLTGDLDMYHFGNELTEMSSFPIHIIARDIDSN